MWIDRQIKPRLIQAVNSRPVVLLTGPRQVGKSSLLKRTFSQHHYVTFDYVDQVAAAQENPQGFLSQFSGPVILDEIQYVPELFRELKIQVDADRERYGKWIITGSQRFSLMDGVSESLAGRMSIHSLETLSAKELRNVGHPSLSDYLWKGGFPELWANPELALDDFFQSYIRTYLERDLKAIIEITNLKNFQRFLKILASRVGQLLNYSSMASDVGVSDVTIRKWLHAAEASGLIYLLPPYFANLGKRLIKSPKVYFADHGLLCHLLNIESMEEWRGHIYRGPLWENVVVMEMIKNSQLRPGEHIFFYRDHEGVEVDLLIEHKDQIILIEAKSYERPNLKKLPFDKLAKLFQKKKIQALLALQTPHPGITPYQSFSAFNPLLIDFSIN